MNLLLDTHILIWALSQNERLSKKAQDYLKNPEHNFYYSIISLWEIAIKNRSSKKPIEFSVEQILQACEEAEYTRIPLEDTHIRYLNRLRRNSDAPPHKDPFDMMLICQAATAGLDEEMYLLTHDRLLIGYEDAPIISV